MSSRKQVPAEDDSPFDFLKKFRNTNHKFSTSKDSNDAMNKNATMNDFA
jgi:hypothetical protein